MQTRSHPLEWLAGHPFEADGLVAGALVVACLLGLFLGGDHLGATNWRHPDAWAVVLTLGLALPITWRRRRPGLTLAIVGTVTVVFYAAGYPPIPTGFTGVIAFYSAVAHRRTPTAFAQAGFALVVLVISLLVSRGSGELNHLAGNAVIFSVAWIVAETVRNRRASTAALRERAERLEFERASEARQAVANERARIARELHDVVAHSMSVMVVQAGAARRVVERNPREATDALRSIEETGRQALDEMRRLLGVLRQDDDRPRADRSPQPTVHDLGLLLDHVREAGLEVSLTVEGNERALPSGVDLSVFRIVQEALTNTLKHAGAASATVVLRWSDREVTVEISDNGRGPAAGNGDQGGATVGHGLVGIRERVALYGGVVHVGHRPGGGFRVRATFPVEASSEPAR